MSNNQLIYFGTEYHHIKTKTNHKASDRIQSIIPHSLAITDETTCLEKGLSEGEPSLHIRQLFSLFLISWARKYLMKYMDKVMHISISWDSATDDFFDALHNKLLLLISASKLQDNLETWIKKSICVFNK